jgi:drug/metabolite transporter (DMT)-like permease
MIKKIILLLLVAAAAGSLATITVDKLRQPTHDIGSIFWSLLAGAIVFLAILIIGGIYLAKGHL